MYAAQIRPERKRGSEVLFSGAHIAGVAHLLTPMPA